jgi:hypothetical protein
MDPTDDTEPLRYNELPSSWMLGSNSCGGDTSAKEEIVSTELNEVLRTSVDEAGPRTIGWSRPGGSTSEREYPIDGERPNESARDDGLAIQSSPPLESESDIGAGEGKVMETGRALTAEGGDSIGERLARGVPIIVSSSAMVGTVDGGRSEGSDGGRSIDV